MRFCKTESHLGFIWFSPVFYRQNGWKRWFETKASKIRLLFFSTAPKKLYSINVSLILGLQGKQGKNNAHPMPFWFFESYHERCFIRHFPLGSGLYAAKVDAAASVMSEAGLYCTTVWRSKWLGSSRCRVQDYFKAACFFGSRCGLWTTVENFGEVDALRIKEIRKATNHDVKAVEYLFKRKNGRPCRFSWADRCVEFAPFCLRTSGDINNTSPWNWCLKSAHWSAFTDDGRIGV